MNNNTQTMLDILKRMTRKIEIMDVYQHSGLDLIPSDWSEINSLINEAKTIIYKVEEQK